VADAGATMEEIVQSVKRVTDIIGEITAATQEQSTGITQVNQAVGQLDQMTQQNAALVEQSAAAAESLKDQAGKLTEAMSVFTFDSAAPSGAATSPAPRTIRSAVAARSNSAVPSPALAVSKARTGPALGKLPISRKVEPPMTKAAATPPASVDRKSNENDWEEF
jgi:uncharacterized phage infection (PIP) family protein YhgE